MDIHSKPIQQRIDWLFDLARRHGESFRSPEAWLARGRYLAEHPTAIAVLKCMDGRINIPVATNTPTGILMPFRNLPLVTRQPETRLCRLCLQYASRDSPYAGNPPSGRAYFR